MSGLTGQMIVQIEQVGEPPNERFHFDIAYPGVTAGQTVVVLRALVRAFEMMDEMETELRGILGGDG